MRKVEAMPCQALGSLHLSASDGCAKLELAWEAKLKLP